MLFLAHLIPFFLLSLVKSSLIKPKVLIVTMFQSEAEVWYNIPEFDILAQNITVSGFSPIYPTVHCTVDSSVCMLTTGQGEINAASTMTALIHCQLFDLATTYFLLAGIAGINPKVATIGSVTLARFAVQVGLQYEVDSREIPASFPVGYFPQGASAPGQLPQSWYGTEVFAVNEDLRQFAFRYASDAVLNDSDGAKVARARYGTEGTFAKGAEAPSITLCDTATSDTWWSGSLISEGVEKTLQTFTNGSGVYCTTQQEDNATLGALLRGAGSHLVDFSRIIIMRSASDFDRPYDGQSSLDNLLGPMPGFGLATSNLYIAGVKITEGIIQDWESRFAAGITSSHYVGDVFGSLGGQPDFGPAGR